MERIVYEKLVSWRNSADRKPLLLNGARQVGKTWLLRELARREYRQEAYVMCRKNAMAQQIFAQDFDVERIIRSLSALTGCDITPGDTLIVLDEVQEIPEAVEALKYFCELAPDYHIAVAGSLLGVAMHRGASFPVGKVQEIYVRPMNFEEFLLAVGENSLRSLLAARDFAALAPLHEKLVGLLRLYYYVGGMPEAVGDYARTGAFQSVRGIQKSILRGYELDFSKHVPASMLPRLRMVWNSIPSQLFKENKKFVYGALRKGARAKDYEEALQWLVDAGLVCKVPRCTKPALPLAIYEDLAAFKLFLVDVGLLGAMVDTEPAQVLLTDDVFTEFKGGMAEQYVLQQMLSHGVAPIYYHTTPDSRLELDFVVSRGGRVLPIEVKAGTSLRANSLSRLLRENPALRAVRISMLPYAEQAQLTNVPLYAV